MTYPTTIDSTEASTWTKTAQQVDEATHWLAEAPAGTYVGRELYEHYAATVTKPMSPKGLTQTALAAGWSAGRTRVGYRQVRALVKSP